MPWQSSPPTGLVQVASQNAGSGATVTLVPASQNKKGLQLWAAAIVSFVASAGPLGGAFQVTDLIQDTASNQYLAAQNGLGVAGQNTSAVSLQFPPVIVPAGAALQVVNGSGAGTALHQVSATVVWSAL